MLRRGRLIGGVESHDGRVDMIVDPSTGATVAEVARATATDVERAVEVAHRAFEQATWSRTPPPERGRILARVAALITERREDLARLESRQAGKPISAARGEIGAVARTFEYYGGAVDKFGGQTIPGGADGTLLTFREPIGVCGIITPWNFPMVILGWKLAPALAMGNSVVVKPASATPLTALALADICAEAGVPAGVVNVVPGPGSIAGDALVGHPLVRKISFTGSTAVGAHVMRIAAPDVKRVSLELGGKSANVVFADADLDDCVQSSVFGAYDNTGQDCCARSRILVERSVFSEFVERFTDRAGTLSVGPTDDDDTDLGPLISTGHRDSVEDYVRIGEQEGATLVCGAERPGGNLSKGSYLTPAVFVDVRPDMRIMQEEIFGPVVAIVPFDGEDEAVTLANDSIYGLSGSLWTRDIGRALRVARRIETGMISINTSSSVHIEAPFGGVKRSGVGREQGMVALEYYSELKSIFIANN